MTQEYVKCIQVFMQYLEECKDRMLNTLDKDYDSKYDICITVDGLTVEVPMNADSYSRMQSFLAAEIEEDIDLMHGSLDHCSMCGKYLKYKAFWSSGKTSIEWIQGIVTENYRPVCNDCASFKPALFGIDPETNDDLFAGYSKGDTWNGWDKPYFTKESMLLIVMHWNVDHVHATYNEATDTCSFKMSDTEYDHYTGIDIVVDGKTVHTYPIGAGSWTWSSYSLFEGGEKNEGHKGLEKDMG